MTHGIDSIINHAIVDVGLEASERSSGIHVREPWENPGHLDENSVFFRTLCCCGSSTAIFIFLLITIYNKSETIGEFAEASPLIALGATVTGGIAYRIGRFFDNRLFPNTDEASSNQLDTSLNTNAIDEEIADSLAPDPN